MGDTFTFVNEPYLKNSDGTLSEKSELFKSLEKLVIPRVMFKSDWQNLFDTFEKKYYHATDYSIAFGLHPEYATSFIYDYYSLLTRRYDELWKVKIINDPIVPDLLKGDDSPAKPDPVNNQDKPPPLVVIPPLTPKEIHDKVKQEQDRINDLLDKSDNANEDGEDGTAVDTTLNPADTIVGNMKLNNKLKADFISVFKGN